MSKLFPIRSSTESGQREPRLLELDDDSTDEVFDALGSDTARMILLELHEGPRPASELADVVDTSIQNVQYHLTKLDAADLVEVADTWYAENGAEMDVYAPTDEALVLFAGRDAESSLQKLLRRLVGALAPLFAGAVALAFWIDRVRNGDSSGAGSQDGDGPGATPGGDAASGSGGRDPDAGEQMTGGGDGDGVDASGTGDGAGGDEDGMIAEDVNGTDGNESVDAATETATPDLSTVTDTATDAAASAGDAVTADPWLAAGLFVAGGLVALGGLYAVDRVLSS